MARAAIKLSGDISASLPAFCQDIAGCAYSPESCQAAFRRDNMVVVIHPREINIYKIENETAAKEVLAWLMQSLEKIGQEMKVQTISRKKTKQGSEGVGHDETEKQNND